MALAMLDKYAADPDFREILRGHGAAVIPPIASTDSGALERSPISGARQAHVHRVARPGGPLRLRRQRPGDDPHDQERRPRARGPARSNQRPVLPVPSLVRRDPPGQRPATGLCADVGRNDLGVVDGCFVITDVLSLAALQPEGAVAAEAVRSEVKAAVREGAKTVSETSSSSRHRVGRKVLGPRRGGNRARGSRESGRVSGRKKAGAMVVRCDPAGGLYQVLQAVSRSPAAAEPGPVDRDGGPAGAKAGLRLSRWRESGC